MNENEKDVKIENEDELFVPITQDTIQSEKIIAPRYSYWKSVFRIFFKKKVNIILISLLVLMFLTAFIGPNIAPYKYEENVNLLAAQHLEPAKAIKFFKEEIQRKKERLKEIDDRINEIKSTGAELSNQDLKEIEDLNAEADTLNEKIKQHGPSIKWILGTGNIGNSIFYGIISSARTSLALSSICAAINMVIGIALGAYWGYSKRFDVIMLVIYNIIANVPNLLLIMVLVYVIGSGFGSFVFALTITGWLGIAFFFRTQTMIIRDREYSLASRCLGTPMHRVIRKNILPYLTSIIVTLLATELPSYISFEVYLSYLGAGLSAEIPSLGRMISQAQTAFTTYPWEFWPPVLVAAALTIILYLLGQNLADATDPRTHM